MLELYLALDCKYIVIGEEVGQGGTPHLQGTIVFKDAKSFTACKAALPGSPHIEACVDFMASFEYCKKEGHFHERGVAPKSQTAKGDAERERWAVALSAAKKGKFEDAAPQIQVTQCRNLEYIHMRQMSLTKLTETEEENLWYWGPTGTGKSRKARADNPDAYLKCCNKWWDHYQDEDVVLIEDFDKNHAVLGHHLKIWADRYPFLGEIKGGTRKMRPRRIIVTSNYSPEDIWGGDDATLGPIRRRFKVVHFDTPFAALVDAATQPLE